MNPFVRTSLALAVGGALLLAQTPKPAPAKPAAAKPAAAKPAAAKPAASGLEKIFKMVTLKLPDTSV
ncbi:MAG: hypothetical protein ACK6D7_14340, partial [Acidobacteriota bacterium]